MNLLKFLGSQFNAATLAPPPLPKAPKSGIGIPGYRTRVQPATSAVPKPTTQMANLDRLLNARNQTSDYQTIKALVKSSPEMASSTALLLRSAIPEKYTLIAYDMDGNISPDATRLAHELMRRLTFMGNSDGSFGVQQGLPSLSESLALDMQTTGAFCLEVALDTQRVPASFNAIAASTLVMYEEGKSFRLKQRIGGDELDLDVPTVIYVTQDQFTTDAYPTSPLTSAVQPVLADLEFNNDIRRALKRAVLPRLKAEIDSEKVKKQTPAEILSDPDKLTEYNNAIVTSIASVINDLNPEDALVSFDFIAYSYIDGGHDPSQVIERVQKVLNAKLVAGNKTLPVALGFATTSNASSTESLLFLKQANGLRIKLNEGYSRAFTMALRLMGQDCYAEFIYDELDLRPAKELEAYRAMHQSRILEMLSLGLISDDYASLMLTGKLPPAGYKPLAGTMFKSASAAPVGNPNSPTSAFEKSTAPQTPTQPKN